MAKLMGWVVLATMCIVGGCAAQRSLNTDAMRGKPLAEVVSENGLDRYESWPMMSLPEGATEQRVHYFLDKGDLLLWYSGEPAVVDRAEYWPSNESARQRFEKANEGWEKWVKAHTETTRPSTR